VHDMQRLNETLEPMAWLEEACPMEDAVTGFDATGWSASTWVLHAMYENSDLAGLGTHDDLHRRRLDADDIAPLIIGDVNLDATTTVTGTPLGFVVRPGRPWVRVKWAHYLRRFPDFNARRDVPPCHRWFPPGSWPVAVEAPPEGSLDAESLDALIAVLSAHSPEGQNTECLAFYASLPAGGDFDYVHLWRGRLGSIPELIDARGGPYSFSPTNFWPTDRAWFVLTDYDLQATKVSGDPTLMAALHADQRLECLDWDAPITT